MKKFRLIIGASCSGKSTLAREFLKSDKNTVELNRDNIRFSLCNNGTRDWSKWKFNKTNENLVTSIELLIAEDAVRQGKHIVSSNTNLSYKTRSFWKDFCKSNSYHYEEIPLQVSWEELVKRNAQREGGLPENILWSQYLRYMQQYGMIGEHPVEVYQPQRNLDFCVICDIDGCVADMRGIRKPYDWDLVSQDKPRSEVIAMLDGLALRNGNVIFMSGRDGVCYEDTIAWLEKHITSSWHPDIKWDLVMREQGDSRKDDIVKYELYQQYVKDTYNVAAVLDDRLSVVRLWTVLGLPNIIQVGDYLNEF